MIEVRISFAMLAQFRHEKLQNAYINWRLAQEGVPVKDTSVFNTGAPYQQIREGVIVSNELSTTPSSDLVLWWYSEAEIEAYRRYREYWSWHARFPKTRGIRPWSRHPRIFPYPIGFNLDRSMDRVVEEMITYSYVYRASKGLL